MANESHPDTDACAEATSGNVTEAKENSEQTGRRVSFQLENLASTTTGYLRKGRRFAKLLKAMVLILSSYIVLKSWSTFLNPLHCPAILLRTFVLLNICAITYILLWTFLVYDPCPLWMTPPRHTSPNTQPSFFSSTLCSWHVTLFFRTLILLTIIL